MVFDKLGRFAGKIAKGAGGGELEVIKWPEHLDPESYVAWRYPKTDIKMGSVVIVDEGQKALFFRDGKLMGVLDSGRHVLDTQNVPFLHGLVSELYGETIFKASIVFVNLRQYMASIADRQYVDYIGVSIVYKITYYFKVDESKLELFYVRLMGADSELTKDDIARKIAPFIKRSIVELLAEYATEQARQGRIVQNLIDFTQLLSEFGETSKASIARRVNEQFGIQIVDIQVEQIDVAPEDKQILQMSGPRAFAAMYQRDWTGREKIAESLSKSPSAGVVAPFMMFPWMMYPPMPPQQPPPQQPYQARPPQGQPAQQAPYQPPPGYPVAASPYQPPQTPQAQMARCPYCGREIPLFAPVCPHCARPIRWCPDGRPVREDQQC
ncbi:MAG: SPFH domain-containing protein [Desulfurococcales archaeon]|nr:SPFH domain-containing protein [Desulfurococcales archaeon]